eukprot:4555821-Pleurochrysis_carterae.AAC.1
MKRVLQKSDCRWIALPARSAAPAIPSALISYLDIEVGSDDSIYTYDNIICIVNYSNTTTITVYMLRVHSGAVLSSVL